MDWLHESKYENGGCEWWNDKNGKKRHTVPNVNTLRQGQEEEY
jgi:hypothetical protein